MIYETIPEKFLSTEFSLFAELYHSVHILNYLRNLCAKVLEQGEDCYGELNDGKALKIGQLINNITAMKENLAESVMYIFDLIVDEDDVKGCRKLAATITKQEDVMIDKWKKLMWENGEHNNVVRAVGNVVKRLNEMMIYLSKKYECKITTLTTNGTLKLDLVDGQTG